ncbi:MAG: oxygen-independent coproporphyrinogen III oxidase-like protein [Zoogloeaceae bacterium]|nr:oxygen-independent coproporphyrinogen III oxidase-like protein [Rhodocyclaceae bacterium]MCP5237644.1 oxygen-independent coproporphyrinogen III oxidase-like protein [Zoogloeaceae bacterium]
MRRIPIAPAPARRTEAPVPSLTASPPLSLYVHFPWCVRKCPYCDFNSHALRGEVPQARYVDALLADLESALPQIWGRRIQSVFVGGGTPSLIDPEQLGRLLDGVRALGNLAPAAEVTLEANPGALDAGRFTAFRDAGVNRLSVGVQSFDDGLLAAIGRIHDGAEARRAVAAAMACFERVNLDLMYGLPGQTPALLAHDLDIALDYGPEHLSCYQLTLEPNTEFHASPPSLPDEDSVAWMHDTVEARLAGAGFEHYEVSAFARPGRGCTHNLNYWRFGDYLGIGAGAHGKLSDRHGVVREVRHRHPRRYLEAAVERAFLCESRQVAAEELPFEFMMNALRLRRGFPRTLFEAVTGLPLSVVEVPLVAARRDGLVAIDADTIRPTELGSRYLNELLQRFLP